MIVNVVKYQENWDELYHKEKRELLNRLDNWTPHSLISYVISQFSRDFGVQNERYYYWR